jgi:two-component system sensor kinase FixL
MPRKHTRADRGAASPRTARSHQELEFRALLDAAVDAIIVVDHHGTIEEFSRAAQQLFGYTPGEIIGRNVRELMPDPYRREHDGYMHRYLTTGEPRIIGTGREVRAQRKDGSIFPCDLSVGHVRGIDPPRFIGFISDITARKQADERLRRSETELQLAQKRLQARAPGRVWNTRHWRT